MIWTSYHGTSSLIAASILSGRVDIALGGGELGQGFYTGERLYLAKQWAFHVSGDRQLNVVQFDTNDDDVIVLNLLLLNARQAGFYRHIIKNMGTTKTYLFGVDMVWAPIVGSTKTNGDQFKWESKNSEFLLNDPALTSKFVF